MSIASPLEQAMLNLINAERAAVGVAPVQFDNILNDAAEDHSSSMLVNNIFSHTGADGSTPRERMVDAGFRFEGANAFGENIGFQSERGAPGAFDDVEDIHDSLMASPGHRANILSANFDEIGIGIVEGKYTSNGSTFDAVMVTQNFAKTDALDVPIVVTPVEPVVIVTTDDEPITPVEPPRRPETKDEEGDDKTVVITPEKPDVEVDEDETVEPVEQKVDEPTVVAEPIDTKTDDETDTTEVDTTETDTETTDTDTTVTDEQPTVPDDTTVPEFEFKDEDDTTKTPGETETTGETGYVWSKTHDDDTYAKVIADFSVSCTAEAYATLDQELQAFVQREFDCNFDIA